MHPKHSWNINNNTNWNTYKNAIENRIGYNPPVIMKIQNRLYTAQQ